MMRRVAGLMAVVLAWFAVVPTSQASTVRASRTPVARYSILMRLGRPNSTEISSIALGRDGDIYLAGDTHDRHFPTSHAAQPHLAAGKCEGGSGFVRTFSPCPDAFIAKLDPTGKAIIYSTFLGGAGMDGAAKIAVDSRGDAFVVGTTRSPDFPQLHPVARIISTWDDALVAEFGPTGRLLFSTRLGGRLGEAGLGIAVDRAGMVYVTGTTGSPDFPLVHPYQSSCWECGALMTPATHAFVAKLNPRTHSIVYSTYLGGQGFEDDGYAVAVDAAGEAIVVGTTESPSFPVVHAFQSAESPLSFNAFVTKLNAHGTRLVYSTLLGGTRSIGTSFGLDAATDVAVDRRGNAVVTGYSYSSDFPLLHAVYPSRSDLAAYFAASFGPSGALRYSTFLGGKVQTSVAHISLGPLDTAEILEPVGQISVLDAEGRLAGLETLVPVNLYAEGLAVARAGQLLLCGSEITPGYQSGPYPSWESQAVLVRLTP